MSSINKPIVQPWVRGSVTSVKTKVVCRGGVIFQI